MRNKHRSNRLSRRTVLTGAGVLSLTGLAGCLDGVDVLDRSSGRGTSGGDGDQDVSRDPPPTVDRNLPEDYRNDELTDAVLSGGPGEDGIPSIDEPVFVEADAQPSILDDDDPVFGVELNGESKAYPQYILVWHEIVNDVFGDESVAVTYCPLTGTAQGFYRGDAELGVSGRLINSNLVMFDRGTGSWYPQILARAIRGPPAGAYLEEFQVIWTTWGRWRDAHPETLLLTDDTGFVRNYGDDPYGEYNPPSGYYENDDTLFPPLTTDDRFHPKAVVIGARTADGAMAVPKEALRDRRVVEGTMDDVPYVTVYDETLDTGFVYRNADEISVEHTDGRYEVDGEQYDPEALPLERVLGFDAMWFAWYGYYPSTAVLE